MNVEARDEGNVRILDLHGRIAIGDGDVALSLAFRDCLAQGHRKIVLGLQHVLYMDSCGLGEVVACKKRALEKNADVRLVIPRASSIPVVVQTCLRVVFPVHDDERAAVASFGG